jgi:excisionase family DNA binding protein
MLQAQTENPRRRRRSARPAPLPEPLAYGLADAARVTGLSRATLRRRAAEGKIRLVKVGGRTLVPAESLKRLLNIAE